MSQTKSAPVLPIAECICCGSARLTYTPVLWKGLIREWQISTDEVNYINLQQGLSCSECRSSLRSMALASAVMRCHGFVGTFQSFVAGHRFQSMRLLEVNESGELTQYLRSSPGHLLAKYPDVDLMAMPYDTATFDLVVHSDTLEHVADPVQALSECRRVLKPGGFCIYTVPMIVGRLTRSRDGLRASYHGDESNKSEGLRVKTEYGADAWLHPVQAGFTDCRICTLAHPAAHAIAAVKGPAETVTG